MAEPVGVGNVEDGEVQINTLGLQDGVQELVDLPLGSYLPVAPREIAGDPLEADNGEPVLLGPVDHPVGKLGVAGNLEVTRSGQLTVAVLQENQTIIVVTHRFLNMIQTRVRIARGQSNGDLCLVKEMKNIMKA